MKYLYFTSKSCAPCKTLMPFIQKKIEWGYNIEIVSIDTEDGLAKAAKYGVTSVPSLAMENDPPAVRIASKKQLLDLLF